MHKQCRVARNGPERLIVRQLSVFAKNSENMKHSIKSRLARGGCARERLQLSGTGHMDTILSGCPIANR